uniref:Uncharacterized protein n=1 Tax=Anguilla anguilla TaxID=7936 RepID=A0A0E9T294_ANGAN
MLQLHNNNNFICIAPFITDCSSKCLTGINKNKRQKQGKAQQS